MARPCAAKTANRELKPNSKPMSVSRVVISEISSQPEVIDGMGSRWATGIIAHTTATVTMSRTRTGMPRPEVIGDADRQAAVLHSTHQPVHNWSIGRPIG